MPTLPRARAESCDGFGGAESSVISASTVTTGVRDGGKGAFFEEYVGRNSSVDLLGLLTLRY